MSKLERSNKWFIRITSPWALLEPKVAEMKGWIDIEKMAIAYHVGSKTEKEHIHIVMTMLKELQRQSIAERIKKLFGVKGNGMLSIKPWDGDLKVYAYLRHDEKGKIDYFKVEFTEEEEKTISSTNLIFKDIVKSAKEKASTRIPDKILEEMHGERWTRAQIIRRILMGVKRGEWYPPGHRMEVLVQEIWIKSDPEAIDALVSYYLDKMRYC